MCVLLTFDHDFVDDHVFIMCTYIIMITLGVIMSVIEFPLLSTIHPVTTDLFFTPPMYGTLQ